MLKPYTDLTFDTWMLGWEAASVIYLRSWRLLAGGPLAHREAKRMVSEKVVANLQLWPAVMNGGLFQSPEAVSTRVIDHYSAPVRANRHRLSRRR